LNRRPIERSAANDRELRLATVTYFVALAFKWSEEGGDIVACDPKEARSPDQAIGRACSLAKMGSVSV
jgi:hypothetical protein